MKKFPKVFAIILNHNGGGALRKCLAGVFKNDYPNFEVIVVDNGSDDGSFEFARANFSKAIFIRNEANLGFAASFNIGIKYALERMADYVLVMKGGIEGDKDFIAKLVESAEKEAAGIISPVIFGSKNNEIFFAGGRLIWQKMKFLSLKKIRVEETFPTEFALSDAMLVSSEVFKKIGFFNEDYFMYGEDVDFCLRARKARFKNIVSSASWTYRIDGENKIKNQAYWKAIAAIIFFKNNSPVWARPFVWARTLALRIKNKKFSAGPSSSAEGRAYADFKNAKY